MANLASEVKIEKIPANISFHSFSTTVAERAVRFEIIKFKDSLYIWIGDGRSRNLQDLSLALLSRFSKEPTSTKIMGEPTNLISCNLASKLSKKLNKPVYVSYNLPDDRFTVPAINERISKELKSNGQYF